MLRYWLVFFVCIPIISFSQELKVTELLPVNDTIFLKEKSIQAFGFSLQTKELDSLKDKAYHVNYEKAYVIVDPNNIGTDSLKVTYYKYPNFLTKTYSILSDSLIAPENESIKRLYTYAKSNNSKEVNFFNGLSTSGSISRGITVGNNQNSVLNSELDLQVSGKLGAGVSLKASLQDSNIPIQENGYSQNLDEFDQIFIELNAKNWSLRAGDIQVEEQESIFSSFTKKIQGLRAQVKFSGAKYDASVFASGALVEGVYNSSTFLGQEGNQGPYKLVGQNGELYILIISGSERVYVNGLLLKRGQNNDYVIDYNSGEVTFNPTFPITSEMRIVVEYQVSEQNYSRILAVTGGEIEKEKWKLKAFVYTENDLKNQSLQQSLTIEQQEVLANSGDDASLMVSDAVLLANYQEGGIFYQNIGTDTNPIYQFYEGGDTEVDVYQLSFSNVGLGNGNYQLSSANTVNAIYEYVAPIDGVMQGSFAPVQNLYAPEKLQLGVVYGQYTPNKTTSLKFEVAASNNDLNLFSSVDDSNNKGEAFSFEFNKRLNLLKKSSTKLSVSSSTDYVSKDFTNVERLYNIEFNRDWNLTDPVPSNQLLSQLNLNLGNEKQSFFAYQFQHLNLGSQYKGNRHLLGTDLILGRFRVLSQSSWLQSKANVQDSEFIRTNSDLLYHGKQQWMGAKIKVEDNVITQLLDNSLNDLSLKYKSFELYNGLGDSTKVYVKTGFKYQETDSVYNASFQKASKARNFYLKSTLVNKPQSQLRFYVNYRIQNQFIDQTTNESVNTRVLHRQSFFKNKFQLSSLLESSGGTYAQQDFTYVEVEPGQGVYTWNDYNDDGVQDLTEFEISNFSDEASYIRVLLPNQNYIPTTNTKLSEQLILNLTSWNKSSKNILRLLSKFYNQTSWLIDREKIREHPWDINVFEQSDLEVGLNSSLRNTLFFNKGKQHYSFIYNHTHTNVEATLVTGFQSNVLKLNECSFIHKIKEAWLFNFTGMSTDRTLVMQLNDTQNYHLESLSYTPKVTYLFNDRSNIYSSYRYEVIENQIGENESLLQNKFNLGAQLFSKKNAVVNFEFNWFENDFEGNSFSNVGYQMLQGLQAGTNFTWQLLLQKNLTKHLELNLNYNGRKSELNRSIHTGTIQLRAMF